MEKTDTSLKQKKNGARAGRRQWLAAWLVVAMVVALSIGLRANAGAPGAADKVYINEDASWHVLLTMESYSAVDAADHLFLPLVTPNDDARGIPWGATLPDDGGLYYYTSFWPLAFVVPWALAGLFGVAATPGFLFVFSSVLYAGCAVLAALALAKLLARRLPAPLVAVLAAAAYLLQPEILHSQGWIYWPHSLNQLLLLGQFYAFLHLDKRVGKAFFFVLCAFVPLAEYTGFVANAGYCLALLCFGPPAGWQGNAEERVTDVSQPSIGLRMCVSTRGRGISVDHDQKTDVAGGPASAAPLRHPFLTHRLLPAVCAGLLTLLAGAGTLFHYTRRLPLGEVLNAMFGSYAVRGDAGSVSFLQYLAMLFRSFRFLWVVLAVLLAAVLLWPAARKALPAMLKGGWRWLLLAAFPMLENLLLRQHSVEYSYARMKAILPLLVVLFMLAGCVWAAAPATKWRRPLAAGLTALVLLSGAAGLAQYLHAPNRYVQAADYLPANTALAETLLAGYPREDSFYGTPLIVRGYTNLLFEGGVLELADEAATLREARARGKRYAVHLLGQGGESNTQRFTGATVYDAASGAEVARYGS